MSSWEHTPQLSITCTQWPLRFIFNYAYSVHYTALQMKSRPELSLKSINSLWKIWTIYSKHRKPLYATINPHLELSVKICRRIKENKGTYVSPYYMYCTYCDMLKHTCQTETTSNSDKNQAITLVIIEFFNLKLAKKISLYKRFCPNLLKLLRGGTEGTWLYLANTSKES